jgi:hypothetical protein
MKFRNIKSVGAVFVVFFAVILLRSPATSAADLSIRLEIASSQMEVGESIPMKIVVEGRGDFSEPSLPEVPGVDITFQGRAQSVQIINMQVRSSKIFTYLVSPRQPGEFVLGPARLESKGSIIESNVVNLKVGKSGNEQIASTGRDIIIEASVDNVKPYVGQQITLLFRFARTADAPIRNATYDLPDLPDFWSEGIESRREYSKNIDGTDYLVTEVAIPLFPVNEGDVTIGPIMMRYDELVTSKSQPQSPFFRDPFGRSMFDDDFFKMFRAENIVKRSARTAPITLQVQPLPLKEKPEDFKGGVGKFSLSARLSNSEVRVGESVTLTLDLSGEGNIRDLSDPNLEMDSLKIYSDNPAITVKNYHDKVVGEKVYKLALVPQQPGQIEIPHLGVPYFNPESERYEIASSNPIELTVLPAEKETLVMKKADESDKASGPSVNADILPIHERIGKMKTDKLKVWLGRIRPLAYPLPLLIYAFCYVATKRKERLKNDIAYRRFKFASKTAEEYLAGAEEALRKKDWNNVFSKSSKAVTEYLAAKLNVPSGGLTPADIKDILIRRSVPRELVNEVTEFLEFCDYGRFTSSRKSPAAASDCIMRTRRLLERLDEEEAISK